MNNIYSIVKEVFRFSSLTRPKKIIFNHLPKCGGSSLNVYLEKHYPLRKTFSIDGSHPLESVGQFKKMDIGKRYSYDLVKGHLAHELINHAHPECLNVTVLREPVDRIISHYYFVKRKKGHYLHNVVTKSDMGLEEYVTSGVSDELQNWYTSHFSGLSVEEVIRNPEEAVDVAVNVVLGKYDIVGFLDDFDKFSMDLKKQANFIFSLQSQRSNVTKGRPSMEEISTSVIEIIKETNRLDIEFYNRIRVEKN